LLTKPSEWKYEKEVRLIFHSDENDQFSNFYTYSKDALKSIIIGEKAEEKNVNTLKKIIKDNGLNIPIKVAGRDRNTYKVIIK
jgi:endo-1,4-beta-mannosidase